MSRVLVDSGIKWIGSLPDTWSITTVNKVFYRRKEVNDVENPTVLSLARDGVKIRDISTNEGQLAESYDNYHKVYKDDLMINPMDLISGANCSLSQVEGVISPAYINLAKKENIFPKYYDYFFKYQYWVNAMFIHGKGVSFDNRWTMNWETMSSYKLPFPKYEEQKNIANYLDKQCAKIDEIISDNNREIELIKEYANNCIIKAIISDNSPFIAIKHIFKVISGSTPSSDNPNYYDGDISWITPADYKTEDVYVENGKRNITIDGYNSCGTSIIPANSIIFSKRAPIGLVAISKKDLCTNQGCLSCVPKKDLNIKYFYYQMSTLQENFELEGSGTTFKEISQDKFKNYKLKYPDINQQNKIVDYLDNICSRLYQVIDYRKQIIEKLEEYKKSLIYECVTGKREV